MMISVTAYGRVSRNAQLMTTTPVSVIDELEATLISSKVPHGKKTWIGVRSSRQKINVEITD